MSKKYALVTGAAQGIGFEFCRQLGKNGYTVILTARNEEKGNAAVQALQEEGITAHFRKLEVTDENALKELAENIGREFGKLDLLINNAGVNSKSGAESDFAKNFRLQELESERMLDLFRVNSVAPIITAKYFLDLLKRGQNARIISMSSWLGSISGKNNGGNYSYCGSKAALNMLNRALAYDVLPYGITAVVINPGWVQTNMGGTQAPLTTKDSVSGMLHLIERLEAKDAGKFYQWDGTEVPW